MKKYRLKLQYKIILYLLILLCLLYKMLISETLALLIVIYYIIAYRLINTLKANIETTKKEDHRTTSKSLGSSKITANK